MQYSQSQFFAKGRKKLAKKNFDKMNTATSRYMINYAGVLKLVKIVENNRPVY